MAEKEKPKGNSLELALAQIEKQFGKGAIMRLGDNEVQKSRRCPRAVSPSTSPSA